MVKTSVALALALGLLAFSFSAYAEEATPVTKLVRGLSNQITSWIELPKQIYKVSVQREPITGILYGSIKGTCYSVMRAAEGVYDTVAFLIPPYDKPLMEPEFVSEGWDDTAD